MGMSSAKDSSKKGKKSRSVLSEINVTPMVDVMLVLLIIFMVASGVQTVEMQSERQKAQEQAEEKLEAAEVAIAELEAIKKHSQVSIDLPKVDADPIKLHEVKKLKLEVDDKLRFSVDRTTLVDCLQLSPEMRRFLGKDRDPNDPAGEQAAFAPCLKALGEKLVDNKKLQQDKELYVLASRSLHYGQVLRVMAAVRQAGVTKFGLVAEAETLDGATVEKTPPLIP